MKLNVENEYNASYLAILPHWKCHKVVRAGKISLMARDAPNGLLMIHAEPSNMPFAVPLDFLYRHNPSIGGYFVVYEDGYISYSPDDVFEAGYHLAEPGTASGGTADAAPAEPLVTDMPPHQLRVLQELADLADKHQKLLEFTGTEFFASLPEAERGRLARQHLAMGDYLKILGERVAAF